MPRSVKTWLFAGIAVLAVAGIIAGFAWVTMPKPVNIDMDSPIAIDAKVTIERMYLLEVSINCVPGTTVDVLAEVMHDSSDYHATASDKDKIEMVYGKQALAHAGLLTSKQAYYLSRDLPAPTTSDSGPEPTLRPTAKPVYICSPDPENRLKGLIRYMSVAQGQDGHIIITYDYTSGRYKAIIRMINGKWKVTSVKMIKWYGNG